MLNCFIALHRSSCCRSYVENDLPTAYPAKPTQYTSNMMWTVRVSRKL